MIDAAITHAFRGRRVLVTGHTGFKGSWLALWLQGLGAQVTGYSLGVPTTPSHFAAAGIAELLARHHDADIRDADRLAAVIDHESPDVIFHLAAQALVLASYAAPRETFDTNVMGTVNVLDAVRRRAKPCVVIVVTSDKCYAPGAPDGGHREGDSLGGRDPYSASKGAAEIVAAAYRDSFFTGPASGIKVACARAGNVIGGGDWAQDRIVVDAITHLARGQAIPVRFPAAVRPWQHVLEPISGYLLLAARLLATDDPKLCSAWNFGPLPGSDITVQNLVEKILHHWGRGSWLHTGETTAPRETATLRLNVDKAISTLGWRPQWDIDQTVARTIGWYRTFAEHPHQSMRAHSLADIAAYTAAEDSR